MSAKNHKGVGLDLIPYEILKFPAVINTLHHLFQMLFDYRMTPGDWCRSLIHPILKSNSSDPGVPMNYRGISLISCIAKLYSATLNRRMMVFSESNDLLPDEQCGFRAGRGCDDQLYVFHYLLQTVA